MESHRQNLPPNLRVRGRGSLSNDSGRFEPYARAFEHDGWDLPEETRPLRTGVEEERPRKVLTRNKSPDVPFDRSVNPYRGCEHGCIYCFARPTHAYLGYSAGLDFETKLIAKPEAAQVLRRELRAPGYVPDTIAIGTNTDPYQPIEKHYRIMRQVLEVLEEFRHPVTIVTKGTLIERDIDILSRMGGAGLARVGISVTTLDARLGRRMEPRAAAPQRRLEIIRRLSDAGCPVRVMVAPVVPSLTDHELERILKAAAEAGADAAEWIMLRLPHEVSPLFREWLHQNFPDRAGRVMTKMRDMHGGEDYDPTWHQRMRGEGEYAQLIAHRFSVACRRLKLVRELPPLRTDLFAVPGRGRQLSLF